MKASVILAFDAATTGCHVALLCGVDGIALSEFMERGQAERLVPMISDVLRQAGRTPADITAIVTTTGPGSFTGVRIGVSTANTLAAVLDVPCAGIDAFDAFDVTHGNGDDPARLVVVETRRDDFFVRASDDAGARVMTAAAAAVQYGGKARILTGDGAARLAAEAGQAQWRVMDNAHVISPEALARYAAARPALFSRVPLVPVYLRDAEISTPTRNRVVFAAVFPGGPGDDKVGAL